MTSSNYLSPEEIGRLSATTRSSALQNSLICSLTRLCRADRDMSIYLPVLTLAPTFSAEKIAKILDRSIEEVEAAISQAIEDERNITEEDREESAAMLRELLQEDDAAA